MTTALARIPKPPKIKPAKPYAIPPTTPAHVEKQTAKAGWLLPQYAEVEALVGAGRWAWWCRVLLNGSLGPASNRIPHIDFGHPDRGTARADLPPYLALEVSTPQETCARWIALLQSLTRDGSRLGDVVSWFLWGMGDTATPARPVFRDPSHQVRLYQEGVQLLCRLAAHPADWAARLLYEVYPKGKAGTGWFPTPMEICKMMAAMQFGDAPGDTRPLSVLDPCVGTGAMLLAASNYSVNLYGCDIDAEMCAWCRLQGYLYIPWLVRPAPPGLLALRPPGNYTPPPGAVWAAGEPPCLFGPA